MNDRWLADFDVKFPWPQMNALTSALGIERSSSDGSPHHGSVSWADHLGLAGYNDNSIKRRRRRVFNVLTFGQAQRWYRARGFGSPPDMA